MRSPAPTTLLALLVAVVGAIAGCSVGSSPSAAPAASSAGPTATPSAAASVAPSGAAASLPVGSSGLTIPHDDPELEAMLPDEFRGVTLDKLSVGPISSAGNPGAQPVKSLAREIGDGSGNFGLAFAHNPDDPTFNLFALRVPGAPAADLLRRFTELTLADTPGGTSDEASLAGRTVTHIAAPASGVGDSWFYAKGDTLYGVQAGSAATAGELLALLP